MHDEYPITRNRGSPECLLLHVSVDGAFRPNRADADVRVQRDEISSHAVT